MKLFPLVALSDIEKLRLHALEQFSYLLENQIRANIFGENIESLGNDFLSEVVGLGREHPGQAPSSLVDWGVRLEHTLHLLHREQKKRWSEGIDHTQKVIPQFNQVAERLVAVMGELAYFSSHDPLTGLHNRRYFNQILDYEVSRSLRHHHAFSVLMLDIDNFKEVNDSYGHPTGDLALQSFAKALPTQLRKADVVARVGGDEFAIVLMETREKGGKNVAEKLRKLVEQLSFESREGHRFHLTVSVGVVSYPNSAKNMEELMSQVDICLYRAKEEGKNRIYALGKKQRTRKGAPTTFILSEHLREALLEGRIVPYFQPILDCNTNKVFAYEVLARLLEAEGEVTPAALFIGAIEKYGLSRPFHEAIISKALEIYQRETKGQKTPPKLFINLSVTELEDRVILGYTEKLCHKLGISPYRIVFELLEREVIRDITVVQDQLIHFRKQGFSFALDDFGSGYNTFHYLHAPFFEYVKIDGSFVRNILTSKIDCAFVRNIAQLCQDLGFVAIAEFTESGAILTQLKKMCVPYAQGFHIGMPQPGMVGL